jgi:hypothetical protein
MKTVVSSIRRLSIEIGRVSDASFWAEKIRTVFGLPSQVGRDISGIYWILRETYNILRPIPPNLIKDCKISGLVFRGDMGESHEFSPNHGYYREGDKTITLNADIFIHPDQPKDFINQKGYFLTRAEQTLIHEMGHAYDAACQGLSLQPTWMKLSGWCVEPRPGLERLHIKEKETPEIVGEYYYAPSAKFTRFYGRRNPWDDFADCFAFFVGGLKDKVPPEKHEYFDTLLKKYF